MAAAKKVINVFTLYVIPSVLCISREMVVIVCDMQFKVIAVLCIALLQNKIKHAISTVAPAELERFRQPVRQNVGGVIMLKKATEK